MKLPRFCTALLAGFVIVAALPASLSAQSDKPAATPSAAISELNALVAKISAKMRSGERTAAALAPEIVEFDALIAKNTEKNEDSAQISYMYAMLFVQGLGDEEKGKSLLAAVKSDFPGTKAATNAERTLQQLSPEAKAKAAAATAAAKAKVDALVGKPAPELNFTWSSQDGLKKLSGLKGKVVVLDFWATWCGPCIASFPQVRKEVAHFKDSPVQFLGVTSIQGYVANMGPRIDTRGDPAKEMALMPDFMKAKEMTWDVVFSEEQVFNPDYGIRGIPYLAIIAPDGTVRHAGLHPGDPAAKVGEKIEALLKEFNLPLPAGKS